MPSLVRIDKNLVNMNCSGSAEVVNLPCLEEMLQRNKSEDEEEEEEETLAEREDGLDEIDVEMEARRRKLAELSVEIEIAKQNALQIVEEARTEAEHIKREAGQQGYDIGYQEAQAALRETREGEKRGMEQSMMALLRIKDEICHEMEDNVLDLSLAVAEKIIYSEFEKNDEVFRDLVRRTLSMVKSQTDIALKLSHVDYRRFFSEGDSELARELESVGIHATPDLTMKSGDCRVTTNYGDINAGIKTQLGRMAFELQQGMEQE